MRRRLAHERPHATAAASGRCATPGATSSAPAAVAALDTARPRPARAARAQRGRDEGDASHLPAFLLRPARLKA